jgi:hypothetical protein
MEDPKLVHGRCFSHFDSVSRKRLVYKAEDTAMWGLKFLPVTYARMLLP